jgi:hypothetical protein
MSATRIPASRRIRTCGLPAEVPAVPPALAIALVRAKQRGAHMALN